MNIDYYTRRKHLFKKRIFTGIKFERLSDGFFKYIYSVKRFRLEFVYIRFLKKLFRRRFIKAKTRFFKPKYWLLFLPNFILTQKSKNARMGAGVGKFVRLTSLVSPGRGFLKT